MKSVLRNVSWIVIWGGLLWYIFAMIITHTHIVSAIYNWGMDRGVEFHVGELFTILCMCYHSAIG